MEDESGNPLLELSLYANTYIVDYISVSKKAI